MAPFQNFFKKLFYKNRQYLNYPKLIMGFFVEQKKPAVPCTGQRAFLTINFSFADIHALHDNILLSLIRK